MLKNGSVGHRPTRHAGYAESQKRRELIEENVGWSNTVGLLRKLRHRGKVLLLEVRWTAPLGSKPHRPVPLPGADEHTP